MAENDPGPEPSYDPPEPAYDSGAGPTQDFRRRDAGDGSARGSDDRGGARDRKSTRLNSSHLR